LEVPGTGENGKAMSVRHIVAARLRRIRALACMSHQKNNRRPCVRDELSSVVERMTNSERNRWARAGYPGLRQRDETQVSVFLRQKVST
jgi:hypothetical protein